MTSLDWFAELEVVNISSKVNSYQHSKTLVVTSPTEHITITIQKFLHQCQTLSCLLYQKLFLTPVKQSKILVVNLACYLLVPIVPDYCEELISNSFCLTSRNRSSIELDMELTDMFLAFKF